MVGGEKKKLVFHQSFQERELQSDVQMPKFTPIQVPKVTPSSIETNHEAGCINLFIPFGNKSHIVIDINILTGNRLCTPGIRPGEFVMLGWEICHHMEWRGLDDSNRLHQHHHKFLKPIYGKKPDLISVVLTAPVFSFRIAAIDI